MHNVRSLRQDLETMCALRPDAGVEPGVLLVASPLLRDPNFVRTVIYILDHHREGSVGVVLNRPSEVTLLDVLPQWCDLAAKPRTLFVGGPVESNAALCLAEIRPGARPDGWTAVAGPVGLTDLDGDPDRLGAGVSQLRVFAGYAGWGAGQLAGEIAEGAWMVVAGRTGDVFADPGLDLWRRVLRRQGGKLALLATYPEDPSLN
jgi:putative transcriptional regulator